MKNPIFLLLMLSAFFGASCQQEKASQANVIVLLIDDAGYADFGFAGSKDLKTPHIDALAKDGLVFTDAHVSASVCGPSRAGLMTGRYQQRFGFECNPDQDGGIDLAEKTIGDAMQSAGYKTAAFGKWHLGGADGYQPNDRGFDYFWGFLSGGRSYFYNAKKDDVEGGFKSIRENREHQTFDGYLTDRLGEKAVDFIDRNKEEPFFMYWAPNAVHTPMEASEEDMKLFEGHPRQKLAAMTWSLDRAVGNITDKLKAEGIYDNTLIFFLSDNGGAHNNQSTNVPLKGFKGNEFEGGHRVRFIMSYPNAIEPGQYDGLSSSLDIFATSVDVAGLTNYSLGQPLDGVSLMPYVTGAEAGMPHEKLFWRKDKMAAARIGTDKLVRVKHLGERFYSLAENLDESEDISEQRPEDYKISQDELMKWEEELMQPLWTEGQKWDTVTYLIHKDLFDNIEPKVKNPEQLMKFLNR